MPELPEVETIRRQISVQVPFTVEEMALSVYAGKMIKKRDFDPCGQQVLDVQRTGKMLEFCFSGHSLLSHLGMSGNWLISEDPIRVKHCHLQLRCRSQKSIWYLGYQDPRRFGTLHFVSESNRQDHCRRFGVDISSEKFTIEYFYSVLQRHPRRPIKPLLLDQRLFAGVGNYIANEICARAGILPQRLCKKISLEECQRLHEASRKLITQAIENQGVTFGSGYRDTRGEKGQGIHQLVVFWQEICRLCHQTPVKKVTLAQRGTYYCPTCQR